MSWQNIHVDDYGWTGRLRLVQDKVAQDISSYTTRQFIFKPPTGAVKVKTATFDTDGVNGVLKYVIESGVIDQVGEWKVQARIAKSGAEITSDEIAFMVQPRLDT
jgi:hypothetical protein